MIGKKIVHDRYGKGEVTHIWRKLINPETKKTRLYALTFKLSTQKGRDLMNKDRSYNGCLLHEPLPRCFESDLTKIQLQE